MVRGQGAIFAQNLQPWIRAFFSISLTTNILATRKSYSPWFPRRPRCVFVCTQRICANYPRPPPPQCLLPRESYGKITG